jgi:hypothetical protein
MLCTTEMQAAYAEVKTSGNVVMSFQDTTGHDVHLSMKWTGAVAYRCFHAGCRFSMKAFIPSTRSSVPIAR